MLISVNLRPVKKENYLPGTGEFEADGFDKAAWISDAFAKIKTNYPRVKIITWFNINKELDWRVKSVSKIGFSLRGDFVVRRLLTTLRTKDDQRNIMLNEAQRGSLAIAIRI